MKVSGNTKPTTKKIYKLMEPNFYMLNFQKILYVAGNLHKKGYKICELFLLCLLLDFLGGVVL